MNRVGVIARITCRPEKRADVLTVFASMFDHLRAGGEPGTEVYAMHTDLEDEDVLWFYELYADRDALRTHARSESMAGLLERLDGLLVGPPHLVKLGPVDAVGLAP